MEDIGGKIRQDAYDVVINLARDMIKWHSAKECQDIINNLINSEENNEIKKYYKILSRIRKVEDNIKSILEEIGLEPGAHNTIRVVKPDKFSMAISPKWEHVMACVSEFSKNLLIAESQNEIDQLVNSCIDKLIEIDREFESDTKN